MDAFISSLPTVSGGILYVKDASLSKDNTMTSAQVEAVGEKGWVPKIKNGSSWLYYHGSDAIAINTTNFPDGNFKSWVKSNCDKDGDGYLSTKEIAAVTRMNINSKSISNLKGIEFFTALTYLSCCYNGLTTLDVSKNTKLRELECYKNQLKTLNVQGCAALEILYCDQNQLTSLNVANYKSLTKLNCCLNNLTSLTVSGCSALKELYCENNQLTSLNVQGCTKLSTLYCENNKINGSNATSFVNSLPNNNGEIQFYDHETATGNSMTFAQVKTATNKGWKVLMVWDPYWEPGDEMYLVEWVNYGGSEATAINTKTFPDDKFRELVGYRDRDENGYLDPDEIAAVTSLSIASNGIASLKGIEYFTALTSLNCHSNQLTELDLTKNTKLQTLQCSNNQLTSLILSKNATSLTSINCDGNRLRGSSVDDFISSLPETGGDLAFYNNETATGNSMTVKQVQSALQMGWAVYYWNEAMNDWVPYFGEILEGDANDDGEVTAEDLATIRDYILGLNPSPFFPEAADMNVDGDVDIVDLTILIKRLKNK